MKSKNARKPDFLFCPQGTIALLRPLNKNARLWAEEHIGQDNGYQPLWPTVLIEHRYVSNILEGIKADGFGLVVR